MAPVFLRVALGSSAGPQQAFRRTGGGATSAPHPRDGTCL